jgi:hypothetical protein
MPSGYYLSGSIRRFFRRVGDSIRRGRTTIYRHNLSPYFSTGGTYSLGAADPSPKKYCSNCFTITS